MKFLNKYLLFILVSSAPFAWAGPDDVVAAAPSHVATIASSLWRATAGGAKLVYHTSAFALDKTLLLTAYGSQYLALMTEKPLLVGLPSVAASAYAYYYVPKLVNKPESIVNAQAFLAAQDIPREQQTNPRAVALAWGVSQYPTAQEIKANENAVRDELLADFPTFCFNPSTGSRRKALKGVYGELAVECNDLITQLEPIKVGEWRSAKLQKAATIASNMINPYAGQARDLSWDLVLCKDRCVEIINALDK